MCCTLLSSFQSLVDISTQVSAKECGGWDGEHYRAVAGLLKSGSKSPWREWPYLLSVSSMTDACDHGPPWLIPEDRRHRFLSGYLLLV